MVESPTTGSSPHSLDLDANERRVLGVLIEKGLSTPEYYPLTLNALLAGCNQKNNRDPVTQLDQAAVTKALEALERRELVISLINSTSRVTRFRQELPRTHGLSVIELAVVGELLLRGAQSEGELRGRASRMRPIETLEALREILEKLREATAARPAFVVRLSPEGSARGVRWTHALFPPEQLEAIRAEESVAASATEPRGAVAGSVNPAARAASDLTELEARLAALEARVARLESERA